MRVRCSRSRRLFTRSTVPLACLLHTCVHACVQERVHTEVGVRSNGEKGVKGGTITVPRFRATTRRHPFDLHPRCRVPNQPAIYPADPPSLSSLNARSHPRRSPRTLFYIPFSFLPSTCRSGNPHSRPQRKKRHWANRLFYCIAGGK